ncbi:MAG: hypothetical protein KDJ80_02990 [Nitratireductor sp.]|nr:hypothetical protein [Nitratireductor sp.]
MRLVKDTSGNFAIILALTIVPVVLLAGLGIDYARMADRKARMQAAADNAIFAAARQATTFRDFKRLAKEQVEANLPGMEVSVKATIGIRTVGLALDTVYETAFMGLAGASEVEIGVEAELANTSLRANNTAPPAAGDVDRQLRQLEQMRTRAKREIDALPPRIQEPLRRDLDRQFTRIANQIRETGESGEMYLRK